MPDKKYPIADMRGIHFSTEGEPRYFSRTRTLCNYCGALHECEVSREERRECTEFLPLLAFRPPIRGFDGRFNTFRLGQAWTKRVVDGSRVALMDTKSHEVFAVAAITDVHSGDKRTMAEQHGANNHNVRVTGVPASEKVGDYMLRRLRNSFGKMIYENQSDATVLYMRVMQWRGEHNEDAVQHQMGGRKV